MSSDTTQETQAFIDKLVEQNAICLDLQDSVEEQIRSLLIHICSSPEGYVYRKDIINTSQQAIAYRWASDDLLLTTISDKEDKVMLVPTRKGLTKALGWIHKDKVKLEEEKKNEEKKANQNTILSEARKNYE